MEKEKKEIGIEKLIELLNEYEPYIASDGEHRDNLWGYAYQGHSAVFPKELVESYIISARYGFIKWLVDNDKIRDLDKLEYVYGIEMVRHGTEELYTAYSLYENLLMLLSISNSPIEDLLLYLK